MPEDKPEEGQFYIVQQGRTFTPSRSSTAPDLSVGPNDRRKVIWHKTDDKAEHDMMLERAETLLGGRRGTAAK